MGELSTWGFSAEGIQLIIICQSTVQQQQQSAVEKTDKGLDPAKLNVHFLCNICLVLSIINSTSGFFW